MEKNTLRDPKMSNITTTTKRMKKSEPKLLKRFCQILIMFLSMRERCKFIYTFAEYRLHRTWKITKEKNTQNNYLSLRSSFHFLFKANRCSSECVGAGAHFSAYMQCERVHFSVFSINSFTTITKTTKNLFSSNFHRICSHFVSIAFTLSLTQSSSCGCAHTRSIGLNWNFYSGAFVCAPKRKLHIHICYFCWSLVHRRPHISVLRFYYGSTC